MMARKVYRQLIHTSFLFFICLMMVGEVFAEDKDVTIEEFLQNLSTVPNVTTRKDPFIEAGPPFDIIQDDSEAFLSAPLLERYPVIQYSIVATLLGDQYPRALVRLPDVEKGKVLIVREKDKLGNKGGIIKKIVREGVVVLQNQRSSLGFVDKAEILLRVGENGADGAAGSAGKTGGSK